VTDYSSETLIANERLKAISNAFFNLAVALVAAIAGRMYLTGVDLVAVGWSVGCAALIWVAWKVLYLLEKEV
jgi:predicted MFS family arabinose efflux permease